MSLDCFNQQQHLKTDLCVYRCFIVDGQLLEKEHIDKDCFEMN